MKYSVLVGGKHAATVELEVAGSSFFGTVSSVEFGNGKIEDGIVAADGSLSGKVSLEGHVANFSAKIDGANVFGSLKYGWFFSEDFAGTGVPA